jgi:CubicO group peptidase (beta-lactamase class C family)
MTSQRIPGLGIGIVRGGTVIARGYGEANIEHHAPVTADTIFQSGSLGKMFTAAAVMLQVEDGKLSLSDSITKFLTDAPRTWRAITVRHLLTHTSGIPDYADLDYRKDYTDEGLRRLAYAQELEFPAGTRWNYSNTGYMLLGLIIGKVSGKFYGDVLTERVFRPAGMSTARVISAVDIVPNRAASYELVDGQIKNYAQWVSPKLNTTADGSLYFTVRDLIAWDAVVRQRGILKPQSWAEILSPVRLASGKSYPYGFGWQLDDRNGQPLQRHGGTWQGFRTEYARFIGDDLSIIVLANAQQAEPEGISDKIAAAIDPQLTVAPLVAIEDKEPDVTARFLRLLDTARAGKLTRAEFAYVRAGFFPRGADMYAKMLTSLGTPASTTLVDRFELGDDRIYQYDLAFGEEKYRGVLGLAPDSRISLFAVFPRPPD